MEVALIRIDPNKNSDDGRPKIIASTVVDTNLKTAEYYRPKKWGILALTRTKFQKRFPGRSFPSGTDTTDKYLLKWAQQIDPVRYKDTEKYEYKDNSPSYILTNTIVLSSDIECSKIKEILAVGDCVYVKCKRRKSVELPRPTLLLIAANHYIFQRYYLLTEIQFAKANKSGAYVPKTTSNLELSKLKTSIEQCGSFTAEDSFQKPKPIDVKEMICHTETESIETGKIVNFCTRFHTGVIKFLKDKSNEEHKPINRILIDCILSKYGNQ